MSFDPNKPFNELPPLPPAVDLESKATLKAAIKANRALAELKGGGELIPDQTVLVQSISLQEARSSSEIEGIVTTQDALYRALSETADTENDPQAKEVLRYSNALWYGYASLEHNRPLSTNLFEELVKQIKNNDAGVRALPGTELCDVQTGRVVYTPPVGEPALRDMLANLEKYMHADDGVDPLIKLPVIHYQFEAIHPFSDGNGRTGRIINILYLVDRGLLDQPVLYLSHYIIENKTEYYRRLQAVTERQEWEPWILYMIEAVEVTARQTLRQITGIRNLMIDYGRRMNEARPKIYSKDIVEELFRRPYCKTAFLVSAGIAKRQTAARYLRELGEIGMLKPIKIGREMYYVNAEFFEFLKQPFGDDVDTS